MGVTLLVASPQEGSRMVEFLQISSLRLLGSNHLFLPTWTPNMGYQILPLVFALLLLELAMTLQLLMY